MKLTLAVDVGLYLRAVQMCSIAYTTHSLFRLHFRYTHNSLFSPIRESLFSTQMSTDPSDESFIVETKCNRLKTANSRNTMGRVKYDLYGLAGNCSQL